MADYKLNDNQIKAISSDSKQILVSASAGTGKTFVMVERVIDLIVNKKVPIDSFLLVTFAKASAEEMRQRIFKSLYDNIEKDKFVVAQLKRLPLAAISTMHHFCADLIRRYFYALDIPPKFAILDEAKAKLQMSKVIDEMFDNKYEKKDKDFLHLVDIFAKSRSDEGLSETVVSLYNFSRGLDNPLEFLTKTAFENYDDLNVFKEVVSSRIDRKLNEFKRLSLNLIDYMFSTVLAKDKEVLLDFVCNIDEILTAKNLDEKLGLLTAIKFSNLKPLDKNYIETELNTHEAVKKLKTDLSSYLKKIKSSEDSIKNDSGIANIKADIVALCNLTIEFDNAYAIEKRKNNCLDFSDLEHFALKLLKNPEVLIDIQEQYTYIFVDEYQDTSKVQEALISAIATNNLFMVGDIKQSIYAFRQCDKNIFAEKERKYKDNSSGQLVFLNQNFRSCGKILSFVNQVFKNIMTAEIGDDYLRNSMFDILDSEGEVELNLILTSSEKEPAVPKIYSVKEDFKKDEEFQNAEKEGKFIANKIKSLVGTTIFDGKTERKLDFCDFAILLRSTSSNHAECIFKTLVGDGIPTSFSSGDSTLVEYSEVCQLKNFLSVLINFQKDIPLLSVMRSPFFGFDDNELLAIRTDGIGRFFFECLKSIPETHALFPKIKLFFDTIEFYKTVALSRGGVFALTRAISETPFEMLTLAMPFGVDKVKRVNKYIQLISGLDSNKNLVELFASIEKLDNDLKSKEAESSTNAVRMMSIHKSKGLEFPICFVSAIGAPFNFKSTTANVLRHADFGVTIRDFDVESRKRKDALPYFAISQIIKDENIEEELRILYVALTRAKCKLILTGIVRDSKGEISNISDLGIEQIVSAEGIYSSKSFLDFIVGGIICEAEPQIKINFIDDDLVKTNVEKLSIDLSKQDKRASDTLDSNLSYRYQRAVDLVLPTKFSASSLKRSPHIEEEVTYAVKSRFTEDSSKIGIAYHKILELSNPFASTLDIEKTMQEIVAKKLVTPEIMQKIDVAACVSTLSHSFMNFGKPLTEKAFIGYFEAELFTEFKTSTRVLIQGVIDLLLYDEKTNSCILVDYKYSGVDNDDVLRARYGEQLRIYHYAVEHILRMKIEKTYIVNVRNGHAIEIPELS